MKDPTSTFQNLSLSVDHAFEKQRSSSTTGQQQYYSSRATHDIDTDHEHLYTYPSSRRRNLHDSPVHVHTEHVPTSSPLRRYTQRNATYEDNTQPVDSGQLPTRGLCRRVSPDLFYYTQLTEDTHQSSPYDDDLQRACKLLLISFKY